MDQWHGSKASVQNHIPASATKFWPEDVIRCTPTPPTQTTTTTSAPSIQDKKKKNQNSLVNFLKYVLGNLGALLTSFQEFASILKNMDKNFTALLAKF